MGFRIYTCLVEPKCLETQYGNPCNQRVRKWGGVTHAGARMRAHGDTLRTVGLVAQTPGTGEEEEDKGNGKQGGIVSDTFPIHT